MIASAARPGRLLTLRSIQAVAACRYAPGNLRPRCVEPWNSIVKQRHQLSRLISTDVPQSGETAFPATGDTIYALSTGAGRAGIAVIRISGPSCLDVGHIFQLPFRWHSLTSCRSIMLFALGGKCPGLGMLQSGRSIDPWGKRPC